MNIIFVFVILFALWLTIEILYIILKITGLDLNKARFQVISMITHTGFTTRESELIVQHPLRRRIASILMVLSYIAQASLISVLFSLLTKNEEQLIYIGILLLALTLFTLFITRNKTMSSRFNRLMERFISRRILRQTDRRTVDEVLKVGTGYGVYEVVIDDHSPVKGLSLEESKLHAQYIHVLKIDRGATVIDFPQADFVVRTGDILIVYGKIQAIKDLVLPRS